MNPLRKALLTLLGERRYLSLLARSFQQVYPTGLLDSGYQDIYFLKEFIQKGDYCLDIGAHLGYYAFELSHLVKQEGRVYAVEPMSKFFQTLQRLVKAKKIKNMFLVQAAMGGKTDWVEMGVPEIGKQKKFAYARVMDSNPYLAYVEKEKVKNENGDALFKDLSRLDFIKCDVEGLEVAVMTSLMATIQSHVPVMLCELADRNERVRLFELLLPFGYQAFFLKEKKLFPMDVYSSTDTISHNHYFIPTVRLDRFKHLIAN
jgi:FkbM family methyltransferase